MLRTTRSKFGVPILYKFKKWSCRPCLLLSRLSLEALDGGELRLPLSLQHGLIIFPHGLQ